MMDNTKSNQKLLTLFLLAATSIMCYICGESTDDILFCFFLLEAKHVAVSLADVRYQPTTVNLNTGIVYVPIA